MKTRFRNMTGVWFAPLLLVLGAPYTWAQPSGYTFQKIAALSTPCSPAPGGGYFQFDFEPWSINNPGDLVFAADLTSRNDMPCATGAASETEGLFLWRKGNLTQITRGGLTAPGGGTLTFGVLAYSIIQ